MGLEQDAGESTAGRRIAGPLGRSTGAGKAQRLVGNLGALSGCVRRPFSLDLAFATDSQCHAPLQSSVDGVRREEQVREQESREGGKGPPQDLQEARREEKESLSARRLRVEG